MDKDNKLLKFFIEKTIFGLLIFPIIWFGSDMNMQKHWHILLLYFPLFYALGYLGDLLEQALIKLFSKFSKDKK